MNAPDELKRPGRARLYQNPRRMRGLMLAGLLTLFLLAGSSASSQSRAGAGEAPMAIKGKLIFQDNFATPTSYTKQLQPVSRDWGVRTAHAEWSQACDGVQSHWKSGHMPVLVYQGTFRDAVIEVDFRYHQEPGKWGGCRISATNQALNPRAYAASVWAKTDSKERPGGMVLEHDEWSPGVITNVDYKKAEFKPDTWYTLRLELIGNKAQASCNGVTVYGTHEKFGLLPKTSLWLGVGTSTHELRNVRVYEATPNPQWKAPASSPIAMPAKQASSQPKSKNNSLATSATGGVPRQQAPQTETTTSASKTDGLTAGWTPAPVKFDIQKAWDLDVSERYRFDAATGMHTLWVVKGDKPHAPPPNHTGPRAELRFRNDYLTGEHMFDADVYIVRGADGPCVMQIWGSGLSATTMMIHVRKGGVLECGGGNILMTDAYAKWFNLKVMHNPAGKGEVKIYIDNQLKATRPGRGYRKDGGGFYFKCGVYGLKGERAEARFRNIRLWEKPAPAGTKSNEDVVADLKAKLPEREKTLRLPENVSKSNPYVEKDPDSSYRHASEGAYNAFRNMKYGVRIHWGLYSLLPAARESWTFLSLSDQERQDYVESYKKFNPTQFDAKEWMKFFERAGFRSFAITTKHHEGFSLFDTKARVHERINYTAPGGPTIEPCDMAYSVMETPFKRDIIRELCDAAHKHNIMINLYFSHSDWFDAMFRPYGRHPMQYPGSPAIKSLEDRQNRPAPLAPPPTQEEQAMMIARHRQQLRELLTNYGKIDMICLDIQLGPQDWPQLRETIMDLRKIQPDVMFRNRGIGNYGDYYTPERVVPGDKSVSPMPWMVIYPLGTNFSWEGDAAKYKGAKWVVNNLADSVAKGGNFMVGIGPDGNGRFHPTAIKQLEEVGDWLKINSEGIFNTHARPGDKWKEGDSVRFTAGDDGKHIYAIRLKRPDGEMVLNSVKPAPGSKIKLLGYDGELPWKTAADGIKIDFPSAAKDSLAYVFKIEAQD